MARKLRFLDNASGIVEVTSRTIQGRFLTLPSDLANDLICGVLGRAQAMYGVEIFAFVFLSNHFHMLLRARSAKQMADFVRFVKSNIARKLGRLYRWKGTFWGGRYDSAPLDDDEGERVQSSRFFYILSNGCKEGLVASPLDWPGVSSARALYSGDTTMTGTWYDETAAYHAKARGERKVFASVETVRLSPLPFLEAMDAEQRRQYVRDAVHELERQTRERHRRKGTKPAGALSVLRRDPHDSAEELPSSPAPWFHCVSRERYRELKAARIATIAAYREAAERLRGGERDVAFPEGSFPPPAPFVETRAPP